MGSGKTTVGKLLAENLNRNFADIDQNIQKLTGRTINDIFEKDGEGHFRDLERAEVEKVSAMDNQVIATGGGVVLDTGNMRSLRRNGIVINLKSSIEALFERLKCQDDRPLISQDVLDNLRKHSTGRKRFYKNSDFIIETDSKTPEMIVNTCVSIVQKPMVRLCVSVSGVDPAGQIANAAESGASMVELRLDLIDTPDIPGLVKKSGLPVIATDRSDKANLRTAIEAGCDFVDIELDSPYLAEITEVARKKSVNVIASLHDYHGTPDKFPERGNADLLKIACLVNSREDMKRLMFLLQGRSDLIVIGMGELGIPSRIIAPLLGSYLTYCTISKETAPGQLTLQNMLDAYKGMGLR